MKITREFAPADRYAYDFGPCSAKNGWAQFDSGQDASYYGNWINPARLAMFSYCEGDTTLKEAENEAEFVAEVLDFVRWCESAGHGPAKIDCYTMPEVRAAFERMGLGEHLH